MKRLLEIRRCINSVILAIVALVWAVVLNGCSMIYEEEGDCYVRYKVEFRFTNNIMETDAFASKVESVNLLVYDKGGRLVTSKTESGNALKTEHYQMEIDVEPGVYDLVAWCGLEGSNAFTLTGGAAPATIGDAICVMSRESDDEKAYSKKQLSPLFHAMDVDVNFPGGNAYGDVVVSVMDLIKDTNTIRIVLTHYNGTGINPDDFTFTIEDNNGKMYYDNTLMDDEIITYREWTKRDMPTVETDGREISSVSSMIAEIDVARLMTTHNPRLTIQARDHAEPVLSLPITQLLLYAKGEAKSAMSDQRYLDCQDEYNLVFFLTDQDGWYMNAGIYINGWHLMLQGADI